MFRDIKTRSRSLPGVGQANYKGHLGGTEDTCPLSDPGDRRKWGMQSWEMAGAGPRAEGGKEGPGWADTQEL